MPIIHRFCCRTPGKGTLQCFRPLRQEYARLYFAVAESTAQLHLDVKTDSADMAWIAYESPELKALKKRTKVKAQVSPRRFLQQLFKNTAKIDEPLKLMTEMYGLTSSLQDVGLNFPAYPQEMEDSLNALFTDAEFRAIYEANNLRMNITNGSMATNEEIPARSAISLWQNIETEADAALRSSQSSATLRFGHDTALYRLLSLLLMPPCLLPVPVKTPTR